MNSTVPAASGAALTLVERYFRFCLVGGTGVVVDMAMLWVLASPSGLGWNLSLGKTVAAELALLNNFLWNDLWTFHGVGGDRGGWTRRLLRLGKFNLICAAGIGLSVLLLNFQVVQLHWNVYVANLVSIFVVSIWNFVMNLKFGWNTWARMTARRSDGR